jgi:chitinase
VRSALDSYAAKYTPGYHFLLTIASPAGPMNYGIMHLSAMNSYVDQWNLMAYDYAGSWGNYSGHQANLFPNPSNPNSTPFSTYRALRDYIIAGVPAHKIVMGIPLYGRSFESTTGLGAPYTGIGTGTWEPGAWDFKALPRAGATEIWDSIAQASYSYNPKTRELISYDNQQSALNKAAYVKSNGLGGAMFWELSGDRSGTGSLVTAFAGSLGSLDASRNQLSYPASQYANIAAGMPGK